MKFKALAVATVLAVGASLASAQTSTWKFDSAHSSADFVIRHMGISNVHGHFGNVSGTINLDDKDITKSSVKATVDTTTVDTGVEQRNTHLKSADFFDVAKYPDMTFVSKQLVKKDGKLELIGDLTMHGVTKSVTLDLDGPSQVMVDPKGVSHRGFSATTSIHRADFGLTYGNGILGDDVKVSLDVEAIKQ
ncbi:MAG TPA: YceI family protein [Acidisarcina sp.]|nr:YceI family protein [Acidisarcina sp.]